MEISVPMQILESRIRDVESRSDGQREMSSLWTPPTITKSNSNFALDPSPSLGARELHNVFSHQRRRHFDAPPTLRSRPTSSQRRCPWLCLVAPETGPLHRMDAPLSTEFIRWSYCLPGRMTPWWR
jgi:hypothetical protein